MHDLISKLIGQARGMWRYRWRALIASWVVCAFGWGLVYCLPDVYEASTRVFVDTETVLRPLLRGLATETNVMNEVNVMTRTLLSRPHLMEVARETDMDLRADTPREMENLIENLRAAIEIRAGRDRLFTFSYRDKDPRMAYAVVQTLLSTFVGDTLQTNRSDSSDALRFLQQQIDEHETRLNDSEQKLATFKKEHVGMMPDETGGYYERLQGAAANLERLRSELTVAQRTRQELIRQIEGEEPVFGLGSESQPQGMSELDTKIEDLEQRLADLRLSYTDKHPDIIALNDTLDRLREQRAEEQAGSLGPDLSPLDLNPVYQSMRIELNQTDVLIARLRTQIAQQQAVVDRMRTSVDTIPEVEAELSRLTRDYEVTKNRYEDLLERLESARLTETAEQTTENFRFRVIDPPTPPLEPIGPNRVLFLSIVLLFSIAVGAATAFMFDQLNPVFHSRQELKKALDLPVLGSVSVALAPKQVLAQRLQLGAFTAGIAMLGVAFGLAVMFRSPAVDLASRVMNRVFA